MKKTQLGRSMIEMLGVLALVGILSVTGLIGYQRAMRTHKITQFLNSIQTAWVQAEGRARASGAAFNVPCSDFVDNADATCNCTNAEGSRHAVCIAETNYISEVCNRITSCSVAAVNCEVEGELFGLLYLSLSHAGWFSMSDPFNDACS